MAYALDVTSRAAADLVINDAARTLTVARVLHRSVAYRRLGRSVRRGR